MARSVSNRRTRSSLSRSSYCMACFAIIHLPSRDNYQTDTLIFRYRSLGSAASHGNPLTRPIALETPIACGADLVGAEFGEVAVERVRGELQTKDAPALLSYSPRWSDVQRHRDRVEPARA